MSSESYHVYIRRNMQGTYILAQSFGSLPVKMLYDTITGATDVDLTAGGFIDAGTEIVTADSVTEPFGLPALTFSQLQELAADPAAARAYYQPLVDGIIADWANNIEPIENEAQ